MICSMKDVSYRYAVEPILDHVDFVINEKDKWGIVGLNGCGKSTFLKLLAGLEQPDSGELTMLSKYRISYCPQESDFADHLSIRETVEAHLKEKYEDYKISSILSRLGFNDYDIPISTLSGGQKKRVSLAIALIQEADLYLLDEPTNHLDQDMILWLEKYLLKSAKAIVLVTHDRYFLSRITNHIVEIDQGKIYCYDGNYADYLEAKEIRYRQELAAEAKRQNFLRSEIEWIRAGAQARSTKQKSRIERYNQIAAKEGPKLRESLELNSAASRLGGKTIEIHHIAKSYDDKKLFSDFSYEVLRHDRLGIIGDNGVGKSTLLKIITGQIQPDEGSVEIGETVRLGYFAQLNDNFDPNQRVIDYLRDFGEVVYTADNEPITASQMLERFLFYREEQYKPISKCSGGEKRRLYLCSILMQAPNVLLLDEPTNDLDTETLGILENYLDDFKGAVLSVSHDRYFLDKTCDHLLIIDEGKITLSNHSYSDYLENRVRTHEEVKEEAKPVQKNNFINRLSYKEKTELEKLNKELPELEQQAHELEEKLSLTGDFKQIREISDALKNVQDSIEEKMMRWMELSEKNGQ